MNVDVLGRGTFTLSLENGSLIISLNGSVIRKTKGNPRKVGNPAFTDLDEAKAYFDTLIFAKPVESEEV